MSSELGSSKTVDRAWVGTDVSLKGNVLIRPHQVESVWLMSAPGSFPDEITDAEEGRFTPSLRSRYAQTGLHAAEYASTMATNAYFEAEDPDSFKFQFPITNLTDAPIFIQRGTDLLRFYIPPEKFIVNGELKELIRNQEVHVDGKEEQDWKYVYKRKGSRVEEDIIGVALKVKEEGRGYIPRSHEPVSISGDEKNYREEVDRFLRPVSERKTPGVPVLWIGETVPLHLKGQVTAEIERDAYPGFQGNALGETSGEHINSRLIDPLSGWPVRVEIFSPTEGRDVADWVIFKFFRQQKQS